VYQLNQLALKINSKMNVVTKNVLKFTLTFSVNAYRICDMLIWRVSKSWYEWFKNRVVPSDEKNFLFHVRGHWTMISGKSQTPLLELEARKHICGFYFHWLYKSFQKIKSIFLGICKAHHLRSKIFCSWIKVENDSNKIKMTSRARNLQFLTSLAS